MSNADGFNDLINLGDNSTQTAKYSGGFYFNQWLIKLIAEKDVAYMNDDLFKWKKVLTCLFKNINGYLHKNELAEVKTKWKAMVNAENEYLKTQGKNNYDPSHTKRGIFYNSLEDFDIYILLVLKKHGLLTPTKEGGHAASQ